MSPLSEGERVVVKSVRFNPNDVVPHQTVETKPDTSEALLDGLFVFHNPFATHPLDPSVFRHNCIAQAYPDYEAGEFVHERREGHLLFRTITTLKTRGTGRVA